MGTLYGLSDNFSRIRMDLVLNALVTKSFFENSVNIYGGQQYRPLLHVKDVSEGIIQCLNKPKVKVSLIYIVKNITIIDLAKKIKKYFPKLKLKILKQEFRDTRNYRVVSDKSKKYFYLNPNTISILASKNIAKTLNERIKDVYDPRYINQLFLKNKL